MTPQQQYEWDQALMEIGREKPKNVTVVGEKPMTPEEDYKRITDLKRCHCKWW